MTSIALTPGYKPKVLSAPIARKAGDDLPAMVCSQVFDSIAIHANGDIVCWCVDVNGDHVYGNVFVDRIADVYSGAAYRAIRSWMLQSKPDTWCPAIDRHCPLRNVAATNDLEAPECRIKILKLEPVTYCNLRCPVCPVESGFKEIQHLRETRAQKLLPLETMIDVVAQLPDLEWIEYFDYGEPFVHKDSIAFLRAARRMRPQARIVTNTNGTVLTPAQISAIATEGLFDRIVFSIDGAAQESYRQYRIGGSFAKAFGKMKALVDACRAAGTWRQYSSDTEGRVQITWQYILFEWNDSDEEVALAKKLAKEVGVPIEWTITSGYGASKRFVHRSALTASLMDPPDSFVHLAANADIEESLKDRGKGRIYDYTEINANCELLKLPYANGHEYKADFRSDIRLIEAPPGSRVIFNVNVLNKTDQSWDADGSNYLRLGVRIQTADGKIIGESEGIKLSSKTAVPGGRESVSIPVSLPALSGEYQIALDVVHEFISWFGDRGSEPLRCSVRVQ